jgi:cytochrome c peroxidase
MADDRRGYQREDYETRSRSLDASPAGATPLLAIARSPPLGLPPLVVPSDNALRAERIALGRRLFFDRRLSGNGTMSCAMCHVPEHGFAHNEMRTAIGIEGRSVRRNAPTVLNAAYLSRLFYDGREFSLENQVWSPLLAANEMGNPSIGYVIETVRGLGDYDGLFESAYGAGPTMLSIGAALASYQRTLLAGDSAFDRWRYGGDESALSPSARRGFSIFVGRGRCSGCHLVGEEHALFTDDAFHNTGIGYARATERRTGRIRLTVAPGVVIDAETGPVEHLGGVPPVDLGRFEITGRSEDRWRYRTPGLRNVALTAPYMHDGSLPTLEAVVAFYDVGGIPNEGLDPRIARIGLSADERADLVEFLRALTGGNVAVLVADALAAPVGD